VDSLNKMEFYKKHQLSSKLLIVDGMWGVGKSIIARLMSVFDDAECWRIDLPFDHIPQLYAKGSIKENAATALIVSLFDEITYNISISRSVNFRFKDESSIFGHPKKYDYMLRLLEGGGGDSLKDKVIIPIATHLSSSNNDFFLRAFGKRCQIIGCVRHPLFNVDYCSGYISRCQTDPRDLTLKFNYNEENLPFFAEGWEDEYLEANNLEKSIKSISLLTKSYDENFDKMKKKYGDSSVLQIPYEDMVMKTDHVISLLSKFVGRDVNSKLYKRIKKRERIPRDSMAEGAGYNSLEWKRNIKNKKSDKIVIEERMKFIKNKVRANYYDEMLLLVESYEKKWRK
jgi:hypothetical protein